MLLPDLFPEEPSEDMSSWSPRRRVRVTIGAVMIADRFADDASDYLSDTDQMRQLVHRVADWAKVPPEVVARYEAKGYIAKDIVRAQKVVNQLNIPV